VPTPRASAASSASAGNADSACSGVRPAAARRAFHSGIDPSGRSTSSAVGIAPSTDWRPMASRRSADSAPPVPSAAPQSCARLRTYVPDEHTSVKSTSRATVSTRVTSSERTWTRRTGGVTSSPRRTFLYSASPPCLMAETAGARCSIAPTKRAPAARISASSSGASDVATTAPDVS
jgi:hypothetical protein